MQHKRWYDNYLNLKTLLTLLEGIDADSIEILAQDFIQIITSDYKDKFDEVIKNLSDNAPPGYNRWYDKNYDMHTCIEFIKTLNENERNKLIDSLTEAVISFIPSTDDYE